VCLAVISIVFAAGLHAEEPKKKLTGETRITLPKEKRRIREIGGEPGKTYKAPEEKPKVQTYRFKSHDIRRDTASYSNDTTTERLAYVGVQFNF
jgi:hypothetical protein